METILLAIALVGSFFFLMAVRIIFKKDGEFQGTCASQSPFLNKEGVTCSICGRDPSDCENKDGGQPKELSEMPSIG